MPRLLSILLALMPLHLLAAIDMQAHVASDEGRAVYTTYTTRQAAYYTGDYAYSGLIELTNDALFGRLNTLMGNTCLLKSGFSYDSLRDQYVKVDRDLNTEGNIISYYNGASFKGVWDSGKTWNREHTWPQSKGADSGPINYDMQSVRPTQTSVNSSRGNTAYGESGSYYDPDEISINNSAYKSSNLGTYRGDAARVIMYDYLVYGEAGGYKNGLHNDKAQLLSKLGSSGVFESLRIMLKWHMQDPPSLTEMVRNDGAQDYQGNRNPLIDYPELAIQVFLDDSITTYIAQWESAAATSFTVQWIADATIIQTDTYNLNGSETIQLPLPPNPSAGYTFVGWTTLANYANPFCPPDDLFTEANHLVTSNLIYYAVFQHNN